LIFPTDRTPNTTPTVSISPPAPGLDPIPEGTPLCVFPVFRSDSPYRTSPRASTFVQLRPPFPRFSHFFVPIRCAFLWTPGVRFWCIPLGSVFCPRWTVFPGYPCFFFPMRLLARIVDALPYPFPSQKKKILDPRRAPRSPSRSGFFNKTKALNLPPPPLPPPFCFCFAKGFNIFLAFFPPFA